MNILITTISPDISSEVDPRFGRGAYYLLVDPDTMEWQAVRNPAVNASGGAGIQAAQYVVDHQCSAVVSGDFGPNAYNALQSAGVAMYLFGPNRTVQEVIEGFKSGQLEPVSAPAPGGHKGHSMLR